MSNHNRVLPGTPSGGEFASQARIDGDVTLAAVPIPPRAYGADDIVGYTYRAEMLRPEDLVERLIAEGRLSPGARGMSAEEALDQMAGVDGVDREDEHTFDSDAFPKVVFGSQVGIDDAPWLGDEYWTFSDYDMSPRTARDALDEFATTLDLDHAMTEVLWEGTDYSKTAEFNISAIARAAEEHGIDLDMAG